MLLRRAGFGHHIIQPQYNTLRHRRRLSRDPLISAQERLPKCAAWTSVFQNIWSESPLHLVAVSSLSCTSILVQYDAAVEARASEEQAPLHHIRYVHPSGERLRIPRVLVKHSADLNANEGGRSLIFYPLASPACVGFLLDRGAHISLRDSEDKSILHYACFEGRA